MRYFKPLSLRTFLLTALAGIGSLLPAASVVAGLPIPAGDLTVTVEEQENGDVQFSLSGTAYMQWDSSPMSSTNYSYSPISPPANGYLSQTVSVPAGLTLTMPTTVTSANEAPEEGPLQEFSNFPIINANFYSGGWYLGFTPTVSLSTGDTITGSGSFTTSDLNFGQYFVPGTFVVGPGGSGSEPEASIAEGQVASSGVYPYFITYEVIAYTQNPSLLLSGPVAFPATLPRKSARTKSLTIKNNGNAALTGLALSITGNEFSSSRLAKTELAPGESTSVDLSFRPKRKGKRSETLNVKALYTPRMPPVMPASEGEIPLEDILEVIPAPVEISASTQLTGQGISRPTRAPRPNTPRFPRGPRS
jgi:hypothetical protein